MYGSRRIKADVLVVGAGLAGIMAAITAAESGANVCIVSRGPVCSGSSFYPGTWGLGLVGPESVADMADLESTILRIGEGMADPELVHTLVSGIPEGIACLENMGIRLRTAQNSGEKEFIPCFDHKNRSWHGLEKAGAAEVFVERLKALNVQMLNNTAVLSLKKSGGRICGAAALATGYSNTGSMTDNVRAEKISELLDIDCKAVVLATGGMGGLFQYCLNTSDVRGTGQYLALQAGAELVNLEFMQMMPGYISPAPKTIYNEKMFGYSRFVSDGRELFTDWPEEKRQSSMAVRSTHGPYTTRLPSGCIDQLLFREFLQHPEGIQVTYQDSIKKNPAEFIRTYFDWLAREKHLTMDDAVQIGIFAHASNGGIRIHKDAGTNVPGLYACGEVTGMMHGADRLGGLSTANGLVFGRIAGRSAAAAALERPDTEVCRDNAGDGGQLVIIPNAGEYLKRLRQWNFRTAMVERSARASEKVLEDLRILCQKAVSERRVYDKENDLASVSAEELLATVDFEAAAALSNALHQVILMRQESRGPHFREDFPEKSEAFGCPLVSRMHQGRIVTEFLNMYSN